MTEDTMDTTERVRHFLRAVYAQQLYALVSGKQTITNVPVERLPVLLASVLIYHAGGIDQAIEACHEARTQMDRIERGAL